MVVRPLAISMGDPTGIGPEVTLKALRRLPRRRVILVGDIGVYERCARRLRLTFRFEQWSSGDPLPERGVPVLVVSELPARLARPGRPTVDGGRAAYVAILEAARLVRSGEARALVTAPICKANLAAAGATQPGHTELLARLCGAAPVRMMMVGPRLRVMLVTTHLALGKVPAALDRRDILETIRLAHSTLRRRFGIRRPRIAVAGLNPHAGEGGMFGDEDRRVIAPAVRAAARAGIRTVGPVAADTLFPFHAAGHYDAVVCMYHDQGLAPFKLLHFRDGANLTCGLPFVRTSPDHGTAHDIAGRGIADASSMVAAIELAARLA